MEQQTIRIKYHSNEIEKLTYIDGKSDWIDLRSAEHVVLKKGEFKLIKLGVSMQLPAGYEAVIVPRSSTYKNFGIIQTNHMGVVDESYCGDDDVWMMPALAMRDTEINVNDRICSSASRNISRSSVLRRQIHLAMKTAAVSEAPEERKL